MKRTLLFLAAAAFATPAAAADITGIWATGSEGGRVEIYRCGKALCGKVVDAKRLRANPDLRDLRNSDPQLRQRKLKGLVVLSGFTGGPTEWKGGPVYDRSEEHTSELQSLMRISYAVFCLTKQHIKH